MSDPRVLKVISLLLLVVAIGLIAVTLLRDGNNMWIALAGAASAFAAAGIWSRADPERYRKSRT